MKNNVDIKCFSEFPRGKWAIAVTHGGSLAREFEMSTDPDPQNCFGGLFKTLFEYVNTIQVA